MSELNGVRIVGQESPTVKKLEAIDQIRDEFPEMKMSGSVLKDVAERITGLWSPHKATAEITEFKKAAREPNTLQEVADKVKELRGRTKEEQINILSSGDEKLKSTVDALLATEEQMDRLDDDTKKKLVDLEEAIKKLPGEKRKQLFDLLQETDQAGAEMWASLQQTWSLNAREDDARTFAWLAANSDERDPNRPSRAGGVIRRTAASVARAVMHPDQEIISSYGGTKGYAKALEANCREQILANDSDNQEELKMVRAGIIAPSQELLDKGLLTNEEFHSLDTQGLKSPEERAEWYVDRFSKQGATEGSKVKVHREKWSEGNLRKIKNLDLDPVVTRNLSALVQAGLGETVLGAKWVGGELEFTLNSQEKFFVDEAINDLSAAVMLRDRFAQNYAEDTSNIDSARILKGAEKYYALRMKDAAAVVDRLGATSVLGKLQGTMEVGWMKMWGGLLSKSGSVESQAIGALKERTSKLLRTDEAVRKMQEQTISEEVVELVSEKIKGEIKKQGITDRFLTKAAMEDFLNSGVWGKIVKGIYTLVGAGEESRKGNFWDNLTFHSRARTVESVLDAEYSDGKIARGTKDGLFDRMCKETDLARGLDEKLKVDREKVGMEDLLLRATLETTKVAREAYLEQELKQMKKREGLDERWHNALKRAGKAGIAVGATFGAIALGEAFSSQAVSALEQARVVAENLAKELATIESFKAASTSLELMRNYALTHAHELVGMYTNQLQGGDNLIVNLLTGNHGLERWFKAWSYGSQAMQGVALSAGLLSVVYGAGSVLAGLGATGESLRGALFKLKPRNTEGTN